MIKSLEVFNILIDRNDYSGALTMLNDHGYGNTDGAFLLDALRYSINFDFKGAKRRLSRASNEFMSVKEVKLMDRSLTALIRGEPDALFSELIESLKFQVISEEYIDFIGRVYRLREAIFKYMFVLRTTGKKDFFMTSPAITRKYLLKTLRKKYKIYNYNLVFAITTYFNRNDKERKYLDVIKILNSEKMTGLIELRNDSIVGHGFTGVSLDDITKIYANPYNVLDDFNKCMALLEVPIIKYKYVQINEFLKEEVIKLNGNKE